MKWFILLAGIATNAAASVLIKIATLPPRRLPSPSAPIEAFANWPFWLGLGLYGCAFVIYTAALARLPLNVAHPILTCGAVAAVALCSRFVFHESFHWTNSLGIALVVAGVALITARAG